MICHGAFCILTDIDFTFELSASHFKQPGLHQDDNV
jgi:hypothetical protein